MDAQESSSIQDPCLPHRLTSATSCRMWRTAGMVQDDYATGDLDQDEEQVDYVNPSQYALPCHMRHPARSRLT